MSDRSKKETGTPTHDKISEKTADEIIEEVMRESIFQLSEEVKEMESTDGTEDDEGEYNGTVQKEDRKSREEVEEKAEDAETDRSSGGRYDVYSISDDPESTYSGLEPQERVRDYSEYGDEHDSDKYDDADENEAYDDGYGYDDEYGDNEYEDENDEYDDDLDDDEYDYDFDDDEYDDEETNWFKKKRALNKKQKQNPVDTHAEQVREGQKKKVWMIGGSIAGVLIIVYLVFSVYFMSHFFYNTKINNIIFGGKTVADAEAYMKQQVEDYELTIVEQGGGKESISGTEISLKYKGGEALKEIMDAQNAFLWPVAFFINKNADAVIQVSFDEAALTNRIQTLKCMLPENQTPPVSAYPKFNGLEYEIVEEVTGSKVKQQIFIEEVHTYVSQFKPTLNMEETGCYETPAFTKTSEEVTAAKDYMNEYLKAKVTYDLSPHSEVVDAQLISQWLTVDENMKVAFNTEAVGSYIDELKNKYDTAGKVRSITTPTGKTSEVSGGYYGWEIDRDGEYQLLIENIQSGGTVNRQLVYSQTAVTHAAQDWGNTYIEVDLTTQHMWYIVDGAVALETDVVTGLPKEDRETPQGVFEILELGEDEILRGDKKSDGTYEYETPVDYWMRVTWSGIGFHDATWQPAFGGELYLTKGSHGCINMPLEKAAVLYKMLSYNCPVIMHY